MACSRLAEHDNYTMTFEDKAGFSRYWLDCATYYFDGMFNITQLSKDSWLYHGSARLAWFNAESPRGLEFYSTPVESNIPKEEMEKILDPNVPDEEKRRIKAKYIRVSPGWYGDMEVARDYSRQVIEVEGKTFNCEDKCIFTFRLLRDMQFVDLSDPYNIYIILTEEWLDDALKRQFISTQFLGTNRPYTGDIGDIIKKLYNKRKEVSSEIDYEGAFTPLKMVGAKKVVRSTMRAEGEDPYLLPKALLQRMEDLGYDGYMNPRTFYLDKEGKPKKYRFAEIVLGREVDWLQRDTDNPYDWQYQDLEKLPNLLRTFIIDMKKYITVNTSFHAGNLYDHSVWTALFMERMLKEKMKPWTDNIDLLPHWKKTLVLGAYLHDIGKAGDGVTVYNWKEEHPETGANYLLEGHKYILADGEAFPIQSLIRSIVDEIKVGRSKVTHTDIYNLLVVFIGMHWNFGNSMMMADKTGDHRAAALDYIEKLEMWMFLSNLRAKAIPLVKVAAMCIIISVADVMGARQYMDHNILLNPERVKEGKINATSKEWPFIQNSPRRYVGYDGYLGFDYPSKGERMRKEILNMLMER